MSTQLRDTPYATEVARGTVAFPSGHEGRIEWLRFKEGQDAGVEGMRFSWWKDERMIPRPLDVTEDQLVALLEDAFAKSVFSSRFLAELQRISQATRP